MKQATLREVYEVASPSFNDLSLTVQIQAGINDWLAEDTAGREFFGRTRAEAVGTLEQHNGIKAAA